MEIDHFGGEGFVSKMHADIFMLQYVVSWSNIFLILNISTTNLNMSAYF
jgi:hypothetical protein